MCSKLYSRISHVDTSADLAVECPHGQHQVSDRQIHPRMPSVVGERLHLKLGHCVGLEAARRHSLIKEGREGMEVVWYT